MIFLFRPSPSRRLFPICLLELVPRPRGVGCANGRSICGCGRDGGLLAFIVSCRSLAERSFAFVLPDVRVFLSCLVFFLLTGSGLGGRRRVPSSFRPVFPVPCVSYCVLAFRPVSSVGSGWLVAPCPPVLVLAIAGRCRVIPSVRFLTSPRRRRLSASRRPCVSSSLCFARLVPRFAVPRRSPSRSSVCLLRSSRSRGGLAPRAALSCLVPSFSPPCLS